MGVSSKRPLSRVAGRLWLTELVLKLWSIILHHGNTADGTEEWYSYTLYLPFSLGINNREACISHEDVTSS